MLVGHKQQWDFLKKAVENEKIPQAFIFSGEESLGKKKAAFEFVKMLFCEEADMEMKPCQKCSACLMVEKANHPDLAFVEPQEKEIQIGQIRQLQERLSLRPSLAKIKSVIINNAHCLNVQAQNCFLKTLEEPQSQTVFILVSSLPDVLLGTIKSRCELLKFYPLSEKEMQETAISEEILHYSQGKPGVAFLLSKNQNVFLEFQNSLKMAKEFLTKPLLSKFLFIKDFFSKTKESGDGQKEGGKRQEECFFLLESMLWHLRKSLWQRAQGEVNIIALLKTKKAIELTEEAKMLLQTTNVSPRLLLENLVLNF